MAQVKSNNPEKTSGSLNKPIPSFSYPLNESLPVSTKLRFVKYNRFTPSSVATEDPTAFLTLPLPVNVPENYSIRTNSQQDLGMWGNVSQENATKIMNFGEENDWDYEKVVKLGTQLTTDMLRNRQFSTSAALGGLGLAVASSDIRRVIQSFSGVVQNPHTTVLFEGVNLRMIYLEWRLAARSEDESRAIRNIFNVLKLQSHPEEIGGGYALNYPDLVYVEFHGKAADYLPKYQKAFINNINITPDSSGGMNLFKSGAPTSYTLQITMTELSILTRNTLQEQIGDN